MKLAQTREQQTQKWASILSCAGVAVLLCCTSAAGQKITDTSDNALTLVIPWTLTPGSSTTPSSVTAQFRLRSNNSTASGGYRVDASATFSVSDTAIVSGGSDIAATDIGVGITAFAYAPNVDTPRADVIGTGFNYDPSAVTGTNGLTTYTGLASGQATIADLSVSRKILSGNRIANSVSTPSPNNYMQVTMTFGAVPQFFTPCTFSSVITLTISNGP